jgi:hypothetical protein
MCDLKTLLRDDERLSAAEFCARLYPDQDRRRATTLGARVLKRPGDFPAHLADEATKQVQQLATDLAAGLSRPSGRPALLTDEGPALLALARDPRLHQAAFARAVFHKFANESALIYWMNLRKGTRKLNQEEARTLRTELQALLDTLLKVK